MNPELDRPRLCVLGSGSGGNCSVLFLPLPTPRLVLIDLGLSPRETGKRLAAVGVADLPIDAVVVTHLDTDHLSPAWIGKVPARLFLHRRHAGRAAREGFLTQPTDVFEREFAPTSGLCAHALLASHDELGVACFRFAFDCGATLGYATDVGTPTPEVVAHLAGVDVLAIESNYCPVMQEASDRPAFLKRRIMGGRGHLSNAQCAHAVRRIAPREHVVLLHLSRQCNTPELAAKLHAAAPYRLTVTRQHAPSPWTVIRRSHPVRASWLPVPSTLWDHAVTPAANAPPAP